MKVHANVMIKNEALVLHEIIPIWNTYAIDEWVFYDDTSTDDTVEVLKKKLNAKVTILNDHLPLFNETHYRSRMLEYSREAGADYVVAIDADELLSANLVENFDEILKANSTYNLAYYWYNLVEGLDYIRQDPLYVNNYKHFIMPMKHTGTFDQYKGMMIHTPRTAPINLPVNHTKEYGFIHLQAINRRFYALKQLRYKHFEYHSKFDQSVESLNERYDPVVNGLEFNKTPIPPQIIGDIQFDAAVYDKMEEWKGFKKYIQENRVEGLITFGKEYLDYEN